MGRLGIFSFYGYSPFVPMLPARDLLAPVFATCVCVCVMRLEKLARALSLFSFSPSPPVDDPFILMNVC